MYKEDENSPKESTRLPGDIRVQDTETRVVRYINRRAYELMPSQYIVLGEGQKTAEEQEQAERDAYFEAQNENARLKAEIERLKSGQKTAEEQSKSPNEEVNAPVSEETTTAEEAGALEQEEAVRRGPGRPKKAE